MIADLVLFDFADFFGHSPGEAAIIVFNLILIESMLSVDNALVMGTMVMDLPKQQRGKALRYGIFGAYFFRGIALLLANYLIRISWLKAAGGLYLLYLSIDYFRKKPAGEATAEDPLKKESNWFYSMTVGRVGKFWSTVIMVNIMDLAFSIDNVFAAVAYTDNIYLICLGVFIGILAIRFVAQGVIRLLENFPFLTGSAFFIIILLGLKLIASFICHEFGEGTRFCAFMESEKTDLYFSLITVSIFIIPVITSWLFNFPKRLKNKQTESFKDFQENMDEAEHDDLQPNK